MSDDTQTTDTQRVKRKTSAHKRSVAPAAINKGGRPSLYSEDLAERICAGIARGKSLVAVLDAGPDMPDYSTVMRWLDAHERFRDLYARARAAQADVLADEIVAIADSATGADDSQAKRLQIDARKWVAAKLKPRVYGDRVALSDPDGQPLGSGLAERLAQLKAAQGKAALPASDPNILCLPADSECSTDTDSESC